MNSDDPQYLPSPASRGRFIPTQLPPLAPALPDSFHKPGLKSQARILHHLFTILDANVITQPLWDVATQPGGAAAFPNNAAFVRAHVVGLLSTSFPNLTQAQVRGGGRVMENEWPWGGSV